MTSPHAPAGRTAPAGPGRWLVNGLIFLTTLFVSGWAFGRGLPFPNVPDLAARLRYYEKHRDQFDTLFIGSSRFRHQIMPAAFDAEASAKGVPTHSIDIGYAGMWLPESYYFLRQFLALKSTRLKWVVIEFMDYRFGHVDEEPPTLRTAYWHDARHTAMACRLVVEAPLPFREKVRLLARHIGLCGRQTLNLGRGSEWLQARWFPARERESRWAARGGFQAEEERTWTDWDRAELARKVAAVEASLPELPARPGFAAALRDIADDVRRAGAEPIFVLAPSVRPAENQVLGLPAGVTVLAFNHPAEYPQLYQWDLHFDTDHLNEKGAREFTRLLAQRVVTEMKNHPGASAPPGQPPGKIASPTPATTSPTAPVAPASDPWAASPPAARKSPRASPPPLACRVP